MISSVVRFWFVLKFSTCDLQIKDAIIELSPLSFFGYLCEETQYLFSSLSLAPPAPTALTFCHPFCLSLPGLPSTASSPLMEERRIVLGSVVDLSFCGIGTAV